MNYLLGAAILKGEIPGVPLEEGYAVLDHATIQGNTMAKVLLGILFSDAAQGLKFGC